MLSAFGTFWSAEGAGVSWPGSDAAIIGLLAFYTISSFVLVRLLSQSSPTRLRAAQVRG
jgi:uncharacterized membrane protein